MSARLRERRRRSEPPLRTMRAGWKWHSHLEDAAAEALTRSYKVVWQVKEDYYGTWVDYESHNCAQLEAAWGDLKKGGVHLGTTDWPYRWSVDLRRLTQTNTWSGTVRDIRRVLVTNS